MLLSKKDILVSICLFTLVFAVYLDSIVYPSGDTRWFIPTALSIIREGNVELGEYAKSDDMKNPSFSYTYETVNGHIYNRSPVGVSIVAIPFIFMINKFFNLSSNFNNNFSAIEAFISSFITALSVILLYYLFRLFLNQSKSILLAIIFAFCTSLWSVVSRTLWQHGPSILMLTISLYLILLARKKSWVIQFTGIPLAFSYVVRPTNIVPLVVFTIYICWEYRRFFLLYIIWAVLILYPFFLFNVSIYHSIISPYYKGHELILSKQYPEALFGLIFSPGRGLFFFTPILLFSIYGIIIKMKTKSIDSMDLSLISIIAIFLIGAAFHHMWWGGWFFGTRFFTDILPYFMYFLIPVVDYALKLKTKKQMYVTIFFLLFTLCSFLIHLKGATSYDAYEWCYKPTNIDNDKSRVWNFNDISFLRPAMAR